MRIAPAQLDKAAVAKAGARRAEGCVVLHHEHAIGEHDDVAATNAISRKHRAGFNRDIAAGHRNLAAAPGIGACIQPPANPRPARGDNRDAPAMRHQGGPFDHASRIHGGFEFRALAKIGAGQRPGIAVDADGLALKRDRALRVDLPHDRDMAIGRHRNFAAHKLRGHGIVDGAISAHHTVKKLLRRGVDGQRAHIDAAVLANDEAVRTGKEHVAADAAVHVAVQLAIDHHGAIADDVDKAARRIGNEQVNPGARGLLKIRECVEADIPRDRVGGNAGVIVGGGYGGAGATIRDDVVGADVEVHRLCSGAVGNAGAHQGAQHQRACAQHELFEEGAPLARPLLTGVFDVQKAAVLAHQKSPLLIMRMSGLSGLTA